MGDEKLSVVDGRKIDCWIIKLSYDNENYDFSWISKSGHDFFKLGSHNPTETFNKVKLFNSDKRF
jgi:hypothetical protein